MNGTLATLIEALVALSGQAIPAPAPVVLMVEERQMPCRCKAAYDAGRVYIRNDIDWTDQAWLSTVLHELAHHAQFLKRGPARNCDEWQARELEALQLQTEYLTSRNSAYRPAMMAACSPSVSFTGASERSAGLEPFR
jgi:hypothetical protein